MNGAQAIAASADTTQAGPSSERMEGCAPSSESSERTERHLRMLQRLAEIGMELAEAVGRQALEQAKAASEPAETPRQPGPDLGLVFTRLSRSVRQTVALEARIAEEPLTPRAVSAAALDKQAERVALAETDRRHRRKAQVGRIVKQAINAELTGIKAYQRERELRERLEDEDVETDIGDHPIGEIIARICWDLGLDPNWRRWAEDHWAVQEARTKAPGSPYAEWGDEEDETDEETLEDPPDGDEAEDSRPVEAQAAGEEPAEGPVPEDPFSTPDYAAHRADAVEYLRSVFSGDRFAGLRPRGAATGSDPP